MANEENIQAFIERLRNTLMRTSEKLDAAAEEYLGKPVAEFAEADYTTLRAVPHLANLIAQCERDEEQLRALETEAARAERDTQALIDQEFWNEDLQGGD